MIPSTSFDRTFRTIWLWSLGFFGLAVLTGFLFRLGMIVSLPGGLSLTNIRHAHSHLMFFNWVTPIPMAFIARYMVRDVPSAARPFKQCIYSVMAIGAASYPFFLFFGYRSVQIGGTDFPVSVVLSGLVMIGWYVFTGIYLNHRSRSPERLPRLFYDASLLMLTVSSLGAWGVAVLQFAGVEQPLLPTAMTHFFLTVFTEGWCVLITLGILYEYSGIDLSPFSQQWLVAPILLGAPLMFPFGIMEGLLTPALLVTTRVGAFLVSTGLILNLYLLRKQIGQPYWRWVMGLLLLKIVMQLGAAALPSSIWLGEHGLRILYIHVLLLGFVSLTFFSARQSLYHSGPNTSLKWINAAILLVLISLVMISGWWPDMFLPSNVYRVIAGIALIPFFAILIEWMMIFRNNDYS